MRRKRTAKTNIKPGVIVLRGPGTNCDPETVYAFETAGARVCLKPINSVMNSKKTLRKYQILVIPGGFSYGDDIAAGKILANAMQHGLRHDIEEFISQKKLIIGICNGFQVLVRMGILPGIDGMCETQEVTLATNENGRFECRWVHLKKNAFSCSPFLKDLPEIFELPVAHGEGKFVPKNRETLKHIISAQCPAFYYTDSHGN